MKPYHYLFQETKERHLASHFGFTHLIEMSFNISNQIKDFNIKNQKELSLIQLEICAMEIDIFESDISNSIYNDIIKRTQLWTSLL